MFGRDNISGGNPHHPARYIEYTTAKPLSGPTASGALLHYSWETYTWKEIWLSKDIQMGSTSFDVRVDYSMLLWYSKVT